MELTPINKIIDKILDYNTWTQQQLADKLRVDKAQISRWLAGERKPSGELYLRLHMMYDQINREEEETKKLFTREG